MDQSQNKPKLAIIGASYLQLPLINTAKNMGLETHVFAWECGDVGESAADYFYPISITEKDDILHKCQEIDIDGICTIASDLAVIAVNYVAEKMCLPGNSVQSSLITTNKYLMRKALSNADCPCPKFLKISAADFSMAKAHSKIDAGDLSADDTLTLHSQISKFEFPIVVKPTDRSGSRAITKLTECKNLQVAIKDATDQSFENSAIIEEFIDGKEYSVECISYRGKHKLLAVTEKFTSGPPHFIETGHLEPADLPAEVISSIKDIVFMSLDALQIVNGASHSEIIIKPNGDIAIVEIGSRMGGDFIGSHLVRLSTGYDFVEGVINVALGKDPDACIDRKGSAAVRFIFNYEDFESYKKILNDTPNIIVENEVEEPGKNITYGEVVDSSSRHGYYIVKGDNRESLLSIFC